MTTGIPNGFWEDAYVLGFLTSTISYFVQAATRGSLSPRDKGLALIGALNNISNQDGAEIARRIVSLKDAKEADFILGFKNAEKCIAVVYGLPGFEDDPDVLKAKETAPDIAKVQSDIGMGSTPNASLGGALQMKLFYDVIEKRFS